MTAKLFEAALGVTEPCHVQRTDFDPAKKTLTITIDFVAGTRFTVLRVEGLHPTHGTVTKQYRHLGFFQPERYALIAGRLNFSRRRGAY